MGRHHGTPFDAPSQNDLYCTAFQVEELQYKFGIWHRQIKNLHADSAPKSPDPGENSKLLTDLRLTASELEDAEACMGAVRDHLERAARFMHVFTGEMKIVQASADK